ncbi:unnamed protein product, partial [marine sediment metagenome]
EEKLVENSARMGEYLLGSLEELEMEFDEVSGARGRGLMCAFDMPTNAERDRLFGELIKNKLLVPKCGERTIRFRPHLDVTREDIDKGLGIIRETLAGMK